MNSVTQSFINTNCLGYKLFGMQMPGRKYSSTHRYGFNGKEQDEEIKGVDGSSLDFGARMYDPRIGRWMSVDPQFNRIPDHSPYEFAFNSPLMFVDPDGEYPVITITTQKVGTGYQRAIGHVYTDMMVKVDLYKVIVTDTDDPTFKMEFAVTRDAFTARQSDLNSDGSINLQNVSFEPKNGQNNEYDLKKINKTVPSTTDLPAFKLMQDDSEVIHAEPRPVAVDMGYRTFGAAVAAGIMLHIGGIIENYNSDYGCASEGCFGVTPLNNDKTNYEDNNDQYKAIMKELSDQIAKTGDAKLIIVKRDEADIPDNITTQSDGTGNTSTYTP